MNERIKELAEQADLIRVLNEHAHEYGNGQFDNTPYPELEKFAELIVKQCGYYADIFESLECPVYMDPTETKPSNYIKKHFGVE